MGFNVGIGEIIASGGVTLCGLILLSIYSLALIWERWRFYQNSLSGLNVFLDKVRACAANNKLSEAVALCRSDKGLACDVVMASLQALQSSAWATSGCRSRFV